MVAPFSSMHGSDVLTFVRDHIAELAVNRQVFLEQSAAVGGSPVTGEELAEIRVLDAAVAIVEFAIAAGKDATVRGRDAPEWVLRMAGQARAALTAPDDED
jgi:hypothetical protein